MLTVVKQTKGCADREREGSGGPPVGRVWELPPRLGHLMRSLKDEEMQIMGTWQWGHLGQRPEARGAVGGGRGVLGDEVGGGVGSDHAQ